MRTIFIMPILLAVLAHMAPPAHAGEIRDFAAVDTPNDAGGCVLLTWRVSPADKKGIDYVIYGAKDPDGPWHEAARISSTEWIQTAAPEYFGEDEKNKEYHFFNLQSIPEIAPEGIDETVFVRMEMKADGMTLASSGTVSATPCGNWFDTTKFNVLIFVLIFSSLIVLLIREAKRNANLFIRHIPGLDAIDEAIGRATEMGKPILYLNGLADMSSLSTIASTSILGKVARKIASYDSEIRVPCVDPIVMSVSQEVVKEAYLEAGRPDSFKQDNVYFLASDQFAYAAAVDGLIIRERPAANLFMGYYYAESLLIAEAGAATGAIQIAGTDAITQIPFFITTCDYTLMGEELYAASAYLSREPLQLGSLKGQDYSKGLIIAILLAGATLATFGQSFFTDLFRTF